MQLKSVVATVVLGLYTGSAHAQTASRYPLTQQLSMDRMGVSVRYPAGWSASQEASVVLVVNAPQERAVPGPAMDKTAQIHVTTETRRDHADAVQRLRSIASEYNGAVTYLTINGWPAMQRRVIVDREQPGNDDESHPEEKLLKITTAIAAGNLLVRAEGRMPPTAGAAVETQVRAIESGMLFRTAGTAPETTRDLRLLRAAPKLRTTPVPRSAVKPAVRRQSLLASPLAPRAGSAAIPSGSGGTPTAPVLQPGLAQVVIAGGFASEPEIAVSTNGQNIVIGQQFVYSTSNDGGQTFSATTPFGSSDGGDTSLAYGKSGNFYEGTINQKSSALNFSTDNGKTFTFRQNAFTCPASGANQCGFTRGTPPVPFPDQEHIAADRFNSATGDQVYFAWRNGSGNYGIACSVNSGQSFGSPQLTSGDFPRITVGQDGFVYVVYQTGNNVNINKYSSCQSGLAVQSGFPLTVVTGSSGAFVNCPVPGLDRCNSGNLLHSHMVTVDDTNANHIFVAYAVSSSSTNENVIIRDSTDGGSTWPSGRAVTVSAASTARRFMPWVCAVGGVAHASWYDRRASTSTNNDLTDYYAGSAFVDGVGNLVAGTEVQINQPGSSDAQCDAGKATGSAKSWPGASRATTDSTSCTVQPQLGGQCRHTPNNSTDSFQACNVGGANTCPVTETCQLGGGIPKYGDYNGSACAAGRLYNIWASATPPPGKPVSGNVDLYFASSILCCSPQIQVPGPVVFPETCPGTPSLQTANVCNDGKADLSINTITSSDSEFSVTTPSSGYPVQLVPGACFPFQVKFSPTSPGPKVSTLTIPSNDPVTPNATITATGTAGTPTIATAIADTGDFGTICPGSFRDLEITLHNNGTCPLIVFGLTSTSTDFKLPSVVTFPLTIPAGGSIDVPVRFEPTSAGAKAGTITVNSNDPSHPSQAIAVKGLGGQPIINTVIADTGDFGTLCRGLFRDLPITIQNSGTCPLKVTGIVSSSPEFQTAQVLSFPLTIAPGTALEIPIRFSPTSSGSKTATITISSDDPASPTKVVNVKADTPPEYICHPPIFAAAGLNIGPTFGPSRTGDFSFGGYGKFLAPFGVRKTYGVQAQGEYLYYHEGRQEGQFDGGLLIRLNKVQVGGFGDFKYAQFEAYHTGGSLGQAAFTLDFLFLKHARFGIFGTKGFHNSEAISAALPPVGVETYMKVVDQFGGSGQVQLPFRTYLEGNLEYLHRSAPGLSDRPGATIRLVHQLTGQIGLTLEGDFNETFVGRHDSGRVVFGIQLGHWPRPRDLSDLRNPLGTDVPRIHYELLQRPR